MLFPGSVTAIAIALVVLLPGSLSAHSCDLESLRLGSSQWIVFGSFRGGNFACSVYVVRPDGEGECRLSPHAEGSPSCLDPSVSEDLSHVLFARGGSDHRTAVWSMGLDGSNERQLTPNVMVRFSNGRARPTPSSDGKSCLYVEESDGVRSIQLLSAADSSDERPVDLGPGEFPSWSPDGSTIAFVEKVDGLSQIWVMNSDGSNREQITNGDSHGYPSWSPTGDKILHSRATETSIELFVMAPDGSDQTQISNTPEIDERDATWSPDGKLLAFLAKPKDAPGGWEKSVFVMDANGGTPTQVTPSKYNHSRPTWIFLPD